MQIIKRKIRSAIWRLQNAIRHAHQSTVKFAVELITERYWLLDYLPTFFKKRDGVLLVRLDLIGDFVLWLDSAQAYRRLYPDQKITLAVNSTCAELAAALPHWDTVISVNVHALRTNYLYRVRTLIRLRWHNFSIVVQPTFSREFVGDITVRSTSAKKRIGHLGDTNNILPAKKSVSDTWYTDLIQINPLFSMELNINAYFVRKLGLSDFLSDVPTITKLINYSKLPFTSSYVLVAPSASWHPKMWPVENFSAVIKELTANYNIQVAICGGPDDLEICDELASLTKLHSNVINIAGKITLPELVEVIRGAALLITNDSAPVHIGAATGTQTVCILGGGHFGRFLPYFPESRHRTALPIVVNNPMSCYGCRWRCEYEIKDIEPVPCIKTVPVAAVYSACKTALNAATKLVTPH